MANEESQNLACKLVQAARDKYGEVPDEVLFGQGGWCTDHRLDCMGYILLGHRYNMSFMKIIDGRIIMTIHYLHTLDETSLLGVIYYHESPGGPAESCDGKRYWFPELVLNFRKSTPTLQQFKTGFEWRYEHYEVTVEDDKVAKEEHVNRGRRVSLSERAFASYFDSDSYLPIWEAARDLLPGSVPEHLRYDCRWQAARMLGKELPADYRYIGLAPEHS